VYLNWLNQLDYHKIGGCRVVRRPAVYGTDDAKTIRAITQAGNDVAESEKRKK